ncbi:ArsR/SmtB family transcription factor [Streptococcus sp. CSL10205-OR2]|uniref:ArsR/SmtB family transcription factor n=1 Tax=Streptococcus sp. CSL10205-OR2 TaxID=2980558 RepID=UPI0021D8AEFB|nr:helix-turn-helix transcriptional regulator [Streptococcus sp. CSL10205-OR2]MCU9533216.1 ArsR family transcriptional regulator [Streptococcus sp. CSL10205-OR2]
MTIKQSNDHQSMILEFLIAPVFFNSPFEDYLVDMTSKQKEILLDTLPDTDQLIELFSKYQEQIKQFYLAIPYNSSITSAFYFYLLNQKKDPKTIKEVVALFKKLSEEEVKYVLSLLISNDFSETSEKEFNYITAIETSDLKADEKWYWLQAFKHPKEFMTGLCDLILTFQPIYQPFYQKYQKEREEFAKRFDVKKTYLKIPNISKEFITNLLDSPYKIFFLSPYLIRLSITKISSLVNVPYLIIASSRINEIYDANDKLDNEDLTSVLKIMSDVTRYEIFAALTKPDIKIKTIAENLGITSSAVTFHTQKLVNSKLLTINKSDDNVKYNLNKELLKDVIKKLENDLLNDN